jgi:hypothetical protein
VKKALNKIQYPFMSKNTEQIMNGREYPKHSKDFNENIQLMLSSNVKTKDFPLRVRTHKKKTTFNISI